MWFFRLTPFRGALLTLVFAGGGLSVAAIKQTLLGSRPPLSNETQSSEILTVKSGRPVAEAALELEKRYGWIITYEDPIYVHSSEIADVTYQVRRDLDQYKPGEAPKVFVPKGGELTINLRLNSDNGRPFLSAESIMQQVLDANTAAGYPGRFRLEKDKQVLNIIPTAYKNSSGTVVPQRSILDSIITIPTQERSGLETLKLLCDAVNRSAQEKMELGTLDPNLFSQSRSQIGVNRLKARFFLGKLLESVNSSANHSWRLLYDPTMRTYYLNIHAVAK